MTAPFVASSAALNLGATGWAVIGIYAAAMIALGFYFSRRATRSADGFLIGERVYHLPEGRAVEVNNLGRHAVRNDGATDRIHLIFEYYDDDQPAPPPLA